MTLSSEKPKFGTWYVNKPTEFLTLKEIRAANSYKRKRTNSKFVEKAPRNDAFPGKPTNNPETNQISNDEITQKLIKELKYADPVKFAPLYKKPNQKSNYFTVGESY